MKKLFLICAALAIVAIKAQAQTDLIARIHFLGGDKISADTNSAAFANEFTSPEARALENQTFDKLSRTPFAWFKSKMPIGANDGTAQLRPLLDDLLKSEWIFEIRDANGSPEYTLAIHLSNERAQIWSKNLSALLQSWTGIGIAQDKADNWELKKHDAPNLFQFGHSGDWVVIDCGQDKLSLRKEILSIPDKIVPPETNWLSTDLNWPRLAQIFPALREFDFPKIQMQVVGRDANFHFNGKLILSQPLPPLEKWRMPTNAIHQPFISYTAVRGVAPWLEKQKWFQPFEPQPQPNQIFVWALPQIPFQTFAAEPVPNAGAALAQLDSNLSANTNWQSHFMMPMKSSLTNNQLSFTGVPFIAPNIRAMHEADGDFLVGGFFPNTPRSKPLPPELFEQLNQPNLVYYHWEITAERLKALPELSQLVLMVTSHQQLNGQSVAHQWLAKIGPTLGNCVTHATETSPTEISFTRKAPGGLTAIELLALANWFESPNFPAFDLRLPERPKLKMRPHPKILSAPMSSPAPAIPVPVQK
ncbi:MAG TPA: hypothetical protein VE344_12455 [Methylomirabilota bacterium]|nr:hypothetical protein [Methylomirabilota bacterium]